MRPIKPEFSTTYYLIKIICSRNVENHIRVLLIDTLKTTKFQMKSLKSSSETADGLLEISADLFIYGKHTQILEDLINKFSTEKEVISACWEIVDKNDD